MCGKLCRVAADGKSGYCETEKKHWRHRVVPASEIRPGPIQHEHLPDLLQDISRWTFSVVGRYVVPTLEQWELGFMRDVHVEREVLNWHRLAFAFITYHRRKGLARRSDDEEKQLIGWLLDAAADDRDEPAAQRLKSLGEEVALLRECLNAPDGWEEEAARMESLAGVQNPRWSPPDHLKDCLDPLEPLFGGEEAMEHRVRYWMGRISAREPIPVILVLRRKDGSVVPLDDDSACRAEALKRFGQDTFPAWEIDDPGPEKLAQVRRRLKEMPED
jgi:hypothetical protein